MMSLLRANSLQWRMTLLNMPVRNTIVFEIYDTLCKSFGEVEAALEIVSRHPECLAKNVDGHVYLMFPHFKVLLEFLLKHGCSIAFFSAGREARNVELIREYLSDDRILGQARYEKLKEDGQFRVYSEHHMDSRDHLPLTQILRPNQTLDDILLVDDYKYYACGGEHPLVEVPRVSDHLNTMYYLLGLFMEYFDTPPALRRSMRTWFNNLRKVRGTWIPVDYDQLITNGLKEVQRYEADAVYYPEETRSDAKFFSSMSNKVLSV